MKKKDLLVSKHNDLIEASYTLTLDEQRLLLSCIAKVDSRKGKDFPTKIEVTGSEYAQNFGIQAKSAYQQLQVASKKLYDRSILIKNTQPGVDDNTRWVDRATYYEGEGKVELYFTPYVKPYLGKLNGMFNSYRLINISGMKSPHSIRLYEILAQWLSTGERFIGLNELKHMLLLGEKYSRYADLRKWVLDPAVNEINDHKTDLGKVTMKPQKTGRKVTSLAFFFGKEKSKS